MPLLDAEQTRPTEGGATYSLANRAIRLLWATLWCVAASWTPAPLHRYRVWLLRLFGANVAWNAHVYSSVKVWLPSNLSMASHSCLGPRVNCYCMAPITLNAGAIISQDVTLCAATHDIHDVHFQLVAKPIAVGKGAWVAAEAFIGPGVTIGERAVIGARAVLFRDAEARGVYVGNPSKKIRCRDELPRKQHMGRKTQG